MTKIAQLFAKCLELARSVPAYLSILRIVSAGSRSIFAASFLVNLLVAQLPAFLAYTSKSVIDSLLSKNHSPSYIGSLSAPIFFGCIYLCLLTAQYVGQVVLVHLSEMLTESGSKHVHTEIIKSAIRMEGLYYFENPAFHNRRSLLEREALYIPMNILRFVTEASGIAVTVLGMVVLLFSLHPVIPLLLIISGIPDVLTQRKAHRLIYEGIKETAHEERKKDYFRTVLLDEEYAKEVRLYNLAGYFINKYNDSFQNIFDLVTPIRKRQIKNSILSRLLVTLGTILPYLWTIGQAVRGEITPGQLVLFMTAIVVIQQQMAKTAQTLAGHQDVIYLMKELAAWLHMKPDLTTVDPAIQMRRKPYLSPHVRISNVWFRYPASDRDVLRGLDLEIPKGKSLAIVGRNGSGKTTLAKLLCRLYDPAEGAIYFDNVDIRLLNLEDLRNSIGIIFQDFNRYQLMIRENIALAETPDLVAVNKVQEAAAAAGAGDFIELLPQGIDALLGNQFEGGRELSGGQWQRLALARAFFRNAGLLILDEPTASLDIATEARIYARFKQMTEGKTSLLISHRLSTVRIADHIAVIDDGKVIELGDHASLMGLGGIYNEMFVIQAERFRQSGEFATL
jgi:ATP-binding cassette subfamily B protein